MARANQGVFAPVTGTNTPLTLLTYSGPVSANSVTIGLKQTIGANESLRTGHVQQDADVHVVDDNALTHLNPAPRHDAAGPVSFPVHIGGTLKLSNLLLSVLVASAVAPATANAEVPPLTRRFTATDVTSANHQWYVSRHDLQHRDDRHRRRRSRSAIPPARRCTTPRSRLPRSRHPAPPRCGATFATPTPAARAPWTASCRFDTPGSYAFVCQVHANMRATVVVAPDSAGSSAGGVVPATLSLTLAPSADLGQFQLAVAADYTATMAATVTSSAGDATLTVNDPEPDGDRPPRQRHVRDRHSRCRSRPRTPPIPPRRSRRSRRP